MFVLTMHQGGTNRFEIWARELHGECDLTIPSRCLKQKFFTPITIDKIA